MKLVSRGKVKDIYEIDSKTIVFNFSNRVSAYDVKFRQDIPGKGNVLCKFAEYWFDKLDVPNHFIRRISDTEMVVKKLEMIPIEYIVRGYFYGSMENNSNYKLAEKLPSPIFDPTTKSDHDKPINKNTIIGSKILSMEDYEIIEETSIKIYISMSKIADRAGFILADLKLEFGFLDGNIILGDSIGPDEYRLWRKDEYKIGIVQKSYDKQILRDWLDINGYKKQFINDLKLNKQSIPPDIPDEIIAKMSDRYALSFENFTNIYRNN